MKKMLSVIVGISMLLSLAACSEEAKKTSSEERVETTTAITSHTVAMTSWINLLMFLCIETLF